MGNAKHVFLMNILSFDKYNLKKKQEINRTAMDIICIFLYQLKC